MEHFYSVSDIARLSGIKRTKIAWMIQLGVIPAPTHERGKRMMYSAAEMEDLVMKLVLWRKRKKKTPLD